MTISTTIIKNSYSGDASNDTFAYQFKISTTADMQVIIRSAVGAETVKTLTTHYTVTGAGESSGGNVVFEAGHIPAATETVILRRSTTQTQALDLVENDPFTADSVESAFDKNLALVQELQEESNRSIKLSRTNTMTSTEFTVGATDRANKILAFDSAGEISVTQELGTFKGSDTTTTTAAYLQRDIIKSTTAGQLNNVYICVADSIIGDTLTDTDHFALLVDAYSAASSATAAAASAVEAQSSEDDAAADLVLTNADVVLTHADVVLTAADVVSSAASAAAAAASADAFDDTYLGSKASDPTLDNDGDALTAGDLYFNSTNDILRVYSGSAWQDAAISSTGVVTLTGTQTLTNKTLTSPKINEAVALTSTATELNLLDGVSGLVQADLTKLAAIDATAAEINLLDGLSRGSILYGNASAATAILTKGTAGQFLTTDGTDISWGAGSSADFSSVGEHILPTTDDTYNLGSATFQWANIYTGDLHLSNESKAEGNIVDGTTGNWTIQEGSEELYILNNKSGKKYKFNLTEV
jgi:hypothetical protein